jgi:hypothetical protein
MLVINHPRHRTPNVENQNVHKKTKDKRTWDDDDAADAEISQKTGSASLRRMTILLARSYHDIQVDDRFVRFFVC